MSSVDYVELGRRLVACKHFRPMRGMRDVQGRTWDESLLWRWENRCDVPDLMDPATVGCVLALVREAWGNKHLWVEAEVDPAMWSLTVYRLGWACVNGESPPPDIEAESEAEALVAALEVAP